MTNIINNMHNQLSSFLTKRYDTILVPELPVKKLVKKTETSSEEKASREVKRVINSRTSHLLVNLSFNKFLEKLKSLCSFRKVKLYIVDESYTSKTCGICGNIKTDLKGEKTYNCNKCNISINRDYNGARNILLKNLE